MELCEVRIPTYKRPALLKRALESLIAQDYPYWQALVMDDSPEQEARLVVAALKDDRIHYAPNPKNLGCAGNINRAFTSQSLMKGCYACVLEDDNWLLPHFLSENITSLNTNRVNLLLRNQEIWLQAQEVATPTEKTTKGNWFIARTYTPLELHAHLFFMEGISNGGLFWQTSLKSNLQVSSQVKDSGLQEYCRTLQICEPLHFEPIPLCAWSEMSSNQSLRNALRNRIFGRGVQSLKQKLLVHYGTSIVLEASKIADLTYQQKIFESSLLDALFTRYPFRQLNIKQQIHQYLKSYAKSIIVQDPLAAYMNTLNLASLLPNNPEFA